METWNNNLKHEAFFLCMQCHASIEESLHSHSFHAAEGELQPIETFTRWSRSLHLPWAVILDDGLEDGHHTVKIRIAAGHDAKATGTALRVFQLLLN